MDDEYATGGGCLMVIALSVGLWILIILSISMVIGVFAHG